MCVDRDTTKLLSSFFYMCLRYPSIAGSTIDSIGSSTTITVNKKLYEIGTIDLFPCLLKDAVCLLSKRSNLACYKEFVLNP